MVSMNHKHIQTNAQMCKHQFFWLGDLATYEVKQKYQHREMEKITSEVRISLQHYLCT
jgi:hypothetical protein